MKICSVCNHAQEEGKFCGKCGAPFTAVETDQAQSETVATTETVEPTEASVQPHPVPPSAAPQQPAEPNEQIEKLKTESKVFFSFFMQQLKSPSAHFNAVNASAKNSLISIILYILTTAIAVYALLRSGFGFYGFGPSFIQTVFYVVVLAILVLVINALAVFVTSKLFSENLTFVEVLKKIGGFFALPILLSVVAMILALINSIGASTMLLYIGSMLAFGMIPTYVMIKLLSQKVKTIDGFYAFLFYTAFTVIVGFILILLIADSAIGDMVRYIDLY